MRAAQPRSSELLDALASSDEAVVQLLRDVAVRGDEVVAAALDRMQHRKQRLSAMDGAFDVARRVFQVKDIPGASHALVDGIRTLLGHDDIYLWLAADGRDCLKPGGGASHLDNRPVSLPRDVALMQRAARARKSYAVSAGSVLPLERVSAPHSVAIPLVSLQNFIGVLCVQGPDDRIIGGVHLQSLELVAELVAPAIAALVCKHVSGRQQHDPLTNLLGRRRFMPDLHRACLTSIKDREPLALLFVDLDRFKEVNDRFGHQVGDEVLQTVATLLRETIRLQDSAYRYGGDELCVIAPGIGGDDALRLAERICHTVAAHYLKDSQGPKMTTSIGVADFDAATMPAARDFTEAADRAVYQAKHDGRNRAAIAAPAGAALARP